MAFVDDVNCVLPIQDVSCFLEKFEEYGRPLGADMNTLKTRILTSTSGRKTSARLSKWFLPGKRALGLALAAAISRFSTVCVDGAPVPH